MVLEVTGEDNIKEVMESVNIELAQISEDEPESTISKTHIKSALEYAGIQENKAESIGDKYMTSINNEEIPLIGDIVPNKAAKIVKDNNEKYLLKEEIKELNRKIATITEDQSGEEPGESDIIIKVNSDKKELIRQETIDGQPCVVIPLTDNDNVMIK